MPRSAPSRARMCAPLPSGGSALHLGSVARAVDETRGRAWLGHDEDCRHIAVECDCPQIAVGRRLVQIDRVASQEDVEELAVGTRPEPHAGSPVDILAVLEASTREVEGPGPRRPGVAPWPHCAQSCALRARIRYMGWTAGAGLLPASLGQTSCRVEVNQLCRRSGSGTRPSRLTLNTLGSNPGRVRRLGQGPLG